MPRYLVVDDDASAVRGLSSLLCDDGHDVVSCTTGADAVAAVQRESFDAIVTDLEMPHVDGQAVVAATREHNPHACVVVVSAAAEAHRERLVDAGVCIIADKPMPYEAITQAVEACRSRRGPGLHGGCYMRAATGDTAIVPLRRK